jgi:hypothetical protein
MLYAGRMRVGGLQQAFNNLQRGPATFWGAGNHYMPALTVFPLIKVVSKLPLC